MTLVGFVVLGGHGSPRTSRDFGRQSDPERLIEGLSARLVATLEVADPGPTSRSLGCPGPADWRAGDLRSRISTGPPVRPAPWHNPRRSAISPTT